MGGKLHGVTNTRPFRFVMHHLTVLHNFTNNFIQAFIVLEILWIPFKMSLQILCPLFNYSSNVWITP